MTFFEVFIEKVPFLVIFHFNGCGEGPLHQSRRNFYPLFDQKKGHFYRFSFNGCGGGFLHQSRRTPFSRSMRHVLHHAHRKKSANFGVFMLARKVLTPALYPLKFGVALFLASHFFYGSGVRRPKKCPKQGSKSFFIFCPFFIALFSKNTFFDQKSLLFTVFMLFNTISIAFLNEIRV